MIVIHESVLFLHQSVATPAKVRAISLDGLAFPEFKKFERASPRLVKAAYDHASRLTPAFFLMNNRTKAIYPAVYGNASYSDLDKRLKEMMKELSHLDRKRGVVV